MPRNEKVTRIRGMVLKNTRIGPVLNIEFAMMIDTVSVSVSRPNRFLG